LPSSQFIYFKSYRFLQSNRL